MPGFPLSLSFGLIPSALSSSSTLGCLLPFNGVGGVQTARYINPATQDFAVGSNNQFLGMNYVDQEVQLALNTQYNSSVLSGFGQNFLSPKVIPQNQKQLNNVMTSLVQQCLQYQIANNSITLGTVSAQQIGPGQVMVSFNYINNIINQNIDYSFLVGA